MSDKQLTIEDAIPKINRRFVAVSTTKGLGLFRYQLYVEGLCMKDLVIDTGLSDHEVNEFRAIHVEIDRHPNTVFLRSLEHLNRAAKTCELAGDLAR